MPVLQVKVLAMTTAQQVISVSEHIPWSELYPVIKTMASNTINGMACSAERMLSAVQALHLLLGMAVACLFDNLPSQPDNAQHPIVMTNLHLLMLCSCGSVATAFAACP